LTEQAQREEAEAFFSGLHGKPINIVQAADRVHHFGNTPTGFKHHPSGSVLHLVNAATVVSLGEAAGVVLAPSRFRPNVVLEGADAWSEFEWLGRTIHVGGATLEVLTRTVRCEATNVDARHGSGRADLDVPGLLTKHFPEHGPYLGVYARVVRGGLVRVGDTLTLSANRASRLPSLSRGGAKAERFDEVIAALAANGLSRHARVLALAAVAGLVLAVVALNMTSAMAARTR
jgi:uncharacterized protein YcbX